MLFTWLKRRRRRRLLSQSPPQGLREQLNDDLAFFQRLPNQDQDRLLDMVRVFVAEKRYEGCGGLEMTDAIQFSIAAQACRLILNIEHDYYRRVRSILVYPTTYEAPTQHGPLVSQQAVLGQAVMRGPVILAWDAVAGGAMNDEDGRNVVYHEFAHKLDMLDGLADGTPRLGTDEQFTQWVAVMTEHFEQLVGKARRGRRSLIDRYGATNPAEFFACATEAFFEKPEQMQRKLPELYEALSGYYRQDPSET